MNRLRLIIVGGTLLILGWVLAFLVVLQVLQQSFLKALVAVLLLTSGTVIGFYGVFMVYRDRRND